MLTKVEYPSSFAAVSSVLAARVPWPLKGPFPAWREAVAAPMREITRSGPIAGRAGDSTQEERYARELAASMGAALPERPRFVFGGAGLALGEMAVRVALAASSRRTRLGRLRHRRT